MYTIVSQQTPQNDIAGSVYKSIDNGNSWIFREPTEKTSYKEKFIILFVKLYQYESFL